MRRVLHLKHPYNRTAFDPELSPAILLDNQNPQTAIPKWAGKCLDVNMLRDVAINIECYRDSERRSLAMERRILSGCCRCAFTLILEMAGVLYFNLAHRSFLKLEVRGNCINPSTASSR